MHHRAAQLIRELELSPHPEGGHFSRVYESSEIVQFGGRERLAVTAIRFLLARGECSRWHRVDADEWWHWQEGDGLELWCFDPASGRLTSTELGFSSHSMPMQVVAAGVWQAARLLGEYALVGCTVSPGFDWAGFELLDPGSKTAAQLHAAGAPWL